MGVRMLKKISRIFLSGLIAISFACGQIDTLDAVSYLPMQIGNKWQFLVTDVHFGDLDTVTIEIIDTVMADNGNTYFRFDPYFMPNPDLWDPPLYHLARIDTPTLSIRLFDSTSCPGKEFYFADLAYRNTSGSDIQDLIADSLEPELCFDGGTHWNTDYELPLLGIILPSIHISTSFTVYFELVPDIGLGYIHPYWHWSNNYSFELIAAQIDSVQNGDFVSTDKQTDQPNSFNIDQNFPNPFNPTTTIQYELPQRSNVQITIYDLLGRKVTNLISEYQEGGFKSVQLSATAVPSGMYFYQIRAGEFVETRKMVVLR